MQVRAQKKGQGPDSAVGEGRRAGVAGARARVCWGCWVVEAGTRGEG